MLAVDIIINNERKLAKGEIWFSNTANSFSLLWL